VMSSSQPISPRLIVIGITSVNPSIYSSVRNRSYVRPIKRPSGVFDAHLKPHSSG